jgi:5'-3' exonuclease
MEISLLDGTYELFRQHFGQPSRTTSGGLEVAAVRGVLATVLSMIDQGTTHLGVATDHVVESFRNEMWAGYKTGSEVPPELFSQFSLLEEGLQCLGVVVWPMVEFEADDALATAAVDARADSRVARVVICSPDKDLGQCVRGNDVVQFIRRTGEIYNEAEIVARFGVAPTSIPDWLALVGDSADGFPGIAGWGKKSAAVVLSHYGHLEQIPDELEGWDPGVKKAARGAAALAGQLSSERDLAMLFRDLATLRTGLHLFASVDELR